MLAESVPTCFSILTRSRCNARTLAWAVFIDFTLAEAAPAEAAFTNEDIEYGMWQHR